MTAARKKVHLPRPGTGGLLTDPLPLWCGLARDLDTCTTSFPHLATCARCIAAQQRYTEESDYQLMRAKRAAESEREAGVADRVHYSKNTTPGLTGLARAICGYWSEQVTNNAEKVTCLACLRILRPPPKNKTRGRGAVHYLAAGSPDALVLAAALAACGPLPPDDHTSSSSSGSEVLTSGVETTSTSGESSTSATPTTTTTGAGESTTSTSSEPSTGGCVEPTCIGASCGVGQECRPNPGTGVPTCVSPCVGPCEAMACGELVPGVCVSDPLGLAWCYPT